MTLVSTDEPLSGACPWNRQRIVELLLRAGEIALEFRRNMKRELKSDDSIVTEADREIERLFAVAFDRPEEGLYLIGEETIEQKGEAYVAGALEGTAHVVDPIDGTAPYSHFLCHWGVSIARMERGVLTDGAIFLPDTHGGEILLNDGPAVLEGVHAGDGPGDDDWIWRELDPVPSDGTRGSLVAISQDIAREGRIRTSNPVQALGAAVVPLAGIIQGRFLAYMGRLKLWDVAGAIPLLHRHGYSLSHLRDPALAAPRVLGLEVDDEHYILEAGHDERWTVRDDLLACPRGEEASLRDALLS